jgi:hypothetical protein
MVRWLGLRVIRFAFKTSPQDTSWEALREVWRAADDIEVFESGWTAETAAIAAAFGAAGAGLAIVSLRPPYTAATLEPLATALSKLP